MPLYAKIGYATCGFMQNMRSDRLRNYSGKLPSLPPPQAKVLLRLCLLTKPFPVIQTNKFSPLAYNVQCRCCFRSPSTTLGFLNVIKTVGLVVVGVVVVTAV